MTDTSGIPAPLAEALSAKGFDTLTPVQSAVLDGDFAGKDLLVSAQTGSGKTVAFGLAIASTILPEGADSLGTAGAPLTLIIAPTRELAQQVAKELTWLYRPAGGKITCCVGGMDPRDERRTLDRGAHIVVGTPGRLCDHIRRGNLNLDDIQTVVLDEADEMLDMGFREELEYILDAAPEHRRTLLFSATVSKPIARLAENFQTDAVRVNTISREDQHADIDYQALTVVPNDVDGAVINLLRFHNAQNTIVFVSRRDAVNKLTSRLHNRGFAVVALSGEYSQKERTNALQAMRDGRANVCVATDVAARGIDLPGLDLVIHAELPRNKEGLLHRSGRTGRAGRKGVCALIVPFRAKRRVERLLQDAKVNATWGNPPTASEIEEKDNARLLNHESLQLDIEDANRPLITALLAKYGAETIAAAFVREQRSAQSAPEDLQSVPKDGGKAPGKRERGSRDRDRDDRGSRFEREPRGRSGSARSDFDNGSWVTLTVGRKTNADPKWILPMLCKAGDLTRAQIGSIQIGQTVTHVELKPDAAEQILSKAGPNGRIDKSLNIKATDGPPSEDDRSDDRPPRKSFQGSKPFKTKSGSGGGGAKTKKPRWAKDDARRDDRKGKGGGGGGPKSNWAPDGAGKKARKPRSDKPAAAGGSGARIVKKKPKAKRAD